MNKLLIIGKIHDEIFEVIKVLKAHDIEVIFVNTIEDSSIYLDKLTKWLLIDVEIDITSFIKMINARKLISCIMSYGIGCSIQKSVDSINKGAEKFFLLPSDTKSLIDTLIKSVDKNTIHKTSRLIVESLVMQEILKIANKISKSNANVLITGESGTGKEVIAQYIHENSNRKNMPFVAVNCAAIPENLIESELFGYEKGSFTGALIKRIGKFEKSSGGTLLLDEISEMDVRLQSKLLRAIQEKEINRIGSNIPTKIDLRIIATSNKNLEQEILNNNFRADLYFRLNIINIPIPVLQHRKDDIIPLAKYFINKYTSYNNLNKKILSKGAIEKINNYSWPGNVRELENIIHRSVLLSESDEIQAQDIYIRQNTEYLNELSKQKSTIDSKSFFINV
ncbi:sigma-54 interaction domain-containing protein [Rickettsia endosymbiont of Cardiosporidium cionae]|uniref:sigma-54 interaction domain-containing protein n=1 Tax=Rickettsia endosymbiont of Cardiosporidium cionae TaxID=2777155 RepID=UPI001895A1A3|nr:sigma-54 dependent transcriptional regulator [Rickettsia endosymbiont of Cardiosporidium cionae]KAF8818869.1 Anaerobic nitric oxide reductase transcription regulator NorR [Rickettsia endosymbiont of Cardiosporidium cionae]